MKDSLETIVARNYLEENWNCAETMLKSCDEYYHLGLGAQTYKLLSAFGGGLQSGNVCGALSGCSAALGSMIVATKAHECEDLRKYQISLIRSFRTELQDTQCARLRLLHFDLEQRCLKTCLAAARAMQETVALIQSEHPELSI